MDMNYTVDAYEQRNVAGELYETPWWQALMNDPRFQAAYERNDQVRLLMSEPVYLKRLLRSESARQQFIEDVFQPLSSQLLTPDEA